MLIAEFLELIPGNRDEHKDTRNGIPQSQDKQDSITHHWEA